MLMKRMKIVLDVETKSDKAEARAFICFLWMKQGDILTEGKNEVDSRASVPWYVNDYS